MVMARSRSIVALRRRVKDARLRELFPFGARRIIVDAGRSYLLDDLHCVRPGCKCKQGVLELVDVEKAETSPDAEWTTARFDLRRKSWLHPHVDRPPSGEARELLAAVKSQHPDTLRWLAARQSLLRKVFRCSRQAVLGADATPGWRTQCAAL